MSMAARVSRQPSRYSLSCPFSAIVMLMLLPSADACACPQAEEEIADDLPPLPSWGGSAPRGTPVRAPNQLGPEPSGHKVSAAASPTAASSSPHFPSGGRTTGSSTQKTPVRVSTLQGPFCCYSGILLLWNESPLCLFCAINTSSVGPPPHLSLFPDHTKRRELLRSAHQPRRALAPRQGGVLQGCRVDTMRHCESRLARSLSCSLSLVALVWVILCLIALFNSKICITFQSLSSPSAFCFS